MRAQGERVLIGLLVGCGLLACIPKAAPVRAKMPVAVSAGFVNDRDEGHGVEPLPEEAIAPSLAALTERNLKVRTVGRETVDVAFRMKRTTAQRLAVLANAPNDPELLVLVETRTRFYSQLNGRYRWTVDAKITLAKPGARDEAVSVEADIPVFLDFDHQREGEALAAAGPRIADEVARLADEIIPGLGAGALRAIPGVKVAGPAVRKAKTARPAESIYFVFVDRFANGDEKNDGEIALDDPQAFHGGDLQGVLDKLDHLQGLGISTVWLSPVFAMRTE